MNTFSHIAIGKLLCAYLEREYGIVLDKTSFVRGNYLPDFSVGLITQPHYLKYRLGFVLHEMTALCARRDAPEAAGRDYSLRLGVLCHYIADFFCFAHSEDFTQNMALHVDYEQRLHRYLMRHRRALEAARFMPEGRSRADAAALGSRMLAYHTDYRRAARSPGNDLVFTLQVCVELIVALFPADSTDESELTGLRSLVS